MNTSANSLIERISIWQFCGDDFSLMRKLIIFILTVMEMSIPSGMPFEWWAETSVLAQKYIKLGA